MRVLVTAMLLWATAAPLAAADALVALPERYGFPEENAYWDVVARKMYRDVGKLARYLIIPSTEAGEVSLGLRFDEVRGSHVLTRRVASDNLFSCVSRSSREACLARVSARDSSIVLEPRSADCVIRLWSRALATVEPEQPDPRVVVTDGPIEIFSQRGGDGRMRVAQMPSRRHGRHMKMLSRLVLSLSDACLLGGTKGERAAQKAVARVRKFCR